MLGRTVGYHWPQAAARLQQAAAAAGRCCSNCTRLEISMWAAAVLLLLHAAPAAADDWHSHLVRVDSASGSVGGGNYSYFELNLPGHVQLVLTSTTGDSDLYASSSTDRPTYTNYDYKSATCGSDVIDVPPDAPRPVYVGVYGCLSHCDNVFKLVVYAQQDRSESFLFGSERGSAEAEHAADSHGAEANENADEGSLLWHIVTLFLKVVFEVLT